MDLAGFSNITCNPIGCNLNGHRYKFNGSDDYVSFDFYGLTALKPSNILTEKVEKIKTSGASKAMKSYGILIYLFLFAGVIGVANAETVVVDDSFRTPSAVLEQQPLEQELLFDYPAPTNYLGNPLVTSSYDEDGHTSNAKLSVKCNAKGCVVEDKGHEIRYTYEYDSEEDDDSWVFDEDKNTFQMQGGLFAYATYEDVKELSGKL